MPTLSQNKDLPDAIKQLRLCSALKSCGQIGVENAFDKSEDENLYVYDDENLGYSDWASDEHTVSLSNTFNARNPNKKTLVLLPLDGRIITGKNFIKGGVCDCALLTEKELSFVEFKTNVLSPNYLTVLQRAKEAKEQLWHTFNGIIDSECQKAGVDVKQNVSVDFYVVFNKDLSVTGVRADLQNLQNEFLMDKHYPLYFDDNKQFKQTDEIDGCTSL